MELYRLTSPAYADRIDGLGGMLVAGRWHSQGHPVLYTTPTHSLATLEMLVQPRKGKTMPIFHLQTLEIPDGFTVEEVPLQELPVSWRQYDPYDPYTQERGVIFLNQSAAVALKVPSAVVPTEYNYILSPTRALAAGLRLVGNAPFELAERLVG